MLSNHTNSPTSQGGSGGGGGINTELKSIEATVTARTTSYESSDLSSPSIDQGLLVLPVTPDGTKKGEIDTSSVDGSEGSTISPLEDEQIWMTASERSDNCVTEDNTKAQVAGNSTSNGEEKVSISAGWTVHLAESVSQMEGELDEALTTAAEAGRNQAKAEDDLVKAQLKAESEAKRLRVRLEEMIQENLMLELRFESTQEDIKDKAKQHAREKWELQVRMDAELEAIRTERRTLLIRVASLEEENDVLTGKLLAESDKDKNSGVLVALGRKLKQMGKKLKSFRTWTKSSRGTQL